MYSLSYRSISRTRPSQRIKAFPQPESVVQQHAHLLPPLERKEPQQMRPSSISGKPRPAGPQSPEITPCTVASSSLAFSPSGLVRIPSPRTIGRSEWINGRPGTFSPSSCCPYSLLAPGTRQGWWDGLQPPAHACARRSFIHIRSFSRWGAFLLSSSSPSLQLFLSQRIVADRACRYIQEAPF